MQGRGRKEGGIARVGLQGRDRKEGGVDWRSREDSPVFAVDDHIFDCLVFNVIWFQLHIAIFFVVAIGHD